MPEPGRRPVLLVLHQEQSTPGRLGRLLQERGYPLDIRRPRFGDPLPETMRDHAGAVIFGGPMSANDPDAFVRREIDWIEVPLREERPFLGLCLGAQMLAKCLGATVCAHPEGRAEIGYYPLLPTEAGRDFAGGDRPALAVPCLSLAPGGLHLPGGRRHARHRRRFPDPAIRVGPSAFGLQFHPEVSPTR